MTSLRPFLRAQISILPQCKGGSIPQGPSSVEPLLDIPTSPPPFYPTQLGSFYPASAFLVVPFPLHFYAYFRVFSPFSPFSLNFLTIISFSSSSFSFVSCFPVRASYTSQWPVFPGPLTSVQYRDTAFFPLLFHCYLSVHCSSLLNSFLLSFLLSFIPRTCVPFVFRLCTWQQY